MMDIETLFDRFEDKLKSEEADEYWNRFIVADQEVADEHPEMRVEMRAALALQLMEAR